MLSKGEKKMKRVTVLAIAMCLLGVAAFADENENDNFATTTGPEVSDYTGGAKYTYNEPFSAPNDPVYMYGGTRVSGPAPQPDNSPLSPAGQDLVNSVNDILDAQ